MSKLFPLLALLSLAIPAVCRAFSEANVSGDYAFTLQVTTTDPAKICNGAKACGGTNNLSGSIVSFYRRLGGDLKAGKCPGAGSQLRGAAAQISAAVPKAGDTFYAIGDLIADGQGRFTDGTATFNSTSAGGEAINYVGAGTSAVLCGGPDISGLCATLCKSPFSPDCPGGGYAVSGNRGIGSLYAYPQLQTGQCGPAKTAADCCNDGSLTIVLHLTFTVENVSNGSSGVAQRVRGVVTNQGAAGLVDAELQ